MKINYKRAEINLDNVNTFLTFSCAMSNDGLSSPTQLSKHMQKKHGLKMFKQINVEPKTKEGLLKQERIRSIDAGILRSNRKLYLYGLYLLPNPKNKCI